MSRFLDARGIEPAEVVPASRKLGRADAVELIEKASRIIAAKGRNVQRFPGGKGRATAEAVNAMLGPTGNLRAPTVRAGKTVLVGFDEEAFAEVLGS